jgi:hypothetical protein
MTEKQFKVTNRFDNTNEHIITITDTVTTEIYCMDTEFEANSLCEKLNSLVEENIHLKQITSQFKLGDIINLKFANRVINGQRKTIRELRNENELLKTELDQCKALINNKWSEYVEKEMNE